MKMVKIHIQRGPLETIPKYVPAHEAELLRAIYGDAAVALVAPAKEDGRRVEDVGAEYERLGRVYGRDREANLPVVQVVYGRMSEGRFEQVLAAAGAIAPLASAPMPSFVAAPVEPVPAAPETQGANPVLPELDADGNGYIKVDEIKRVLDALGAPYQKDAKRGELLEAATVAARAEVDRRAIEVGADLELLELLDVLREDDEARADAEPALAE